MNALDLNFFMSLTLLGLSFAALAYLFYQNRMMFNKNMALQNRDNEQKLKIETLLQQVSEAQSLQHNTSESLTVCQEQLNTLGLAISSKDTEITQSNLRREELLALLDQEKDEKNRIYAQMIQLEKQLTEQKTINKTQETQFKAIKENLTIEFEHLSQKIFKEKSDQFSNQNSTALESLLKPFKEQITHFQNRVNEVHAQTIKENANLNLEIKKVMDVGLKMSAEADHLAQALKGNKKTIGNWGELQLERNLQMAGLVENIHYTKESVFKDKDGQTRRLDFLILLPEQKHLILDSKVSLNDYEKAIIAETENEMNAMLDEHVQAVKRHVMTLSEKNYSNLNGLESPNFVLMYMPIEPAYTVSLQHAPDLFEYAFNKNVILVSNTTLLPILRTIANIWIMEQSNQETKNIADKAGEIYNTLCTLAERIGKVGSTIETLAGQYNNSIKALSGKQGLYGKVERFDKLSSKIMKKLPKLEPIHCDIEQEKLTMIESKTEQPVS